MNASRVRSMWVNARTSKYYLSTALLAGLFVLAITITAMRGPQSEAGIRDSGASSQSPIPAPTPQYDRDPVALLDAYRHVEVASVSDAIEQLLGKRMYLSHRMQPLG